MIRKSRAVIFRSAAWRRFRHALNILAVASFFVPCICLGSLRPSGIPRIQPVDIRIRPSDLTVVDQMAPSNGDLLDDVAVVRFGSMIHVKVPNGLVRGQSITYWIADEVTLPDGTVIEPVDADDALVAAANDAFERTLPAGSIRTVTNRGTWSWRVVEPFTDWRHAAYVISMRGYLVMLVSTVGLWMVYLVCAQRARTRLKRGQCWRCGYDLTDSRGVPCPECGETDHSPAVKDPHGW